MFERSLRCRSYLSHRAKVLSQRILEYPDGRHCREHCRQPEIEVAIESGIIEQCDLRRQQQIFLIEASEIQSLLIKPQALAQIEAVRGGPRRNGGYGNSCRTTTCAKKDRKRPCNTLQTDRCIGVAGKTGAV